MSTRSIGAGVRSTGGLRLRGLSVVLESSGLPVLKDIDLDLGPGRLMGVVGESGSGKTTLGQALLGYARPGLRMSAETVEIGGVDLSSMRPAQLRTVRGRLVTYVPQDAASALNPTKRVGDQIAEVLQLKGWEGPIRARVAEVIGEVNLPADAAFMRRYPYQLSGGQQQRVGIAMAFACRPDLVVMDEPTTGLDVLTQTKVLETVRRMVQIHGCSGVYISHDLSVVANLVDDVAVMYAGSIVEQGAAGQVFRSPRHPYTSRLIAAVPQFDADLHLEGIPGTAPAVDQRGKACTFAPRCRRATPECLQSFPSLTHAGEHSWRCLHPLTGTEDQRVTTPRTLEEGPANPGTPLVQIRAVTAEYDGNPVLHGVDLDIPRGRCVGLLGESGSGKTTLSRILAGVPIAGAGEVRLDGELLRRGTTNRSATQRRRTSYIFQNPYGSLNPRRPVGESVAFPLRLLGEYDRTATRTRVARAIELVALPATAIHKYPRELSGGERQRAAIARALVTDPDFLICDEVTSALDVSVQASIVRLLNSLREEVGLTMLFVTHDIALLGYVADQIAVLQHGSIVELGPTPTVLYRPDHPYTRDLVVNAKSLTVTVPTVSTPHAPTRSADNPKGTAP